MCDKCQETMQPVTKKTDFVGTLAQLEVKLDACHSITGCILEYLPGSTENSTTAFYFNEIGNLASALDDILDLCRGDVKRAYERLEQGANHE